MGSGSLWVRSGPPITRSQDRGYPGLSRSPVLTRVQALSCALALPAQAETRCCHVACYPWRKPAGGAWRKASGPHGLFIYCGEDASPVHPADRRWAASALIVTCPLSWQAASRPSYRRRACLVHCQTVRPCCKVHCVHHHLCVAREASPTRQYHADRGCQGARRLLQQLQVLHPLYSWAHMSGPSTLVRAPWAIKGEACNVTDGGDTQTELRLRPSLGSQVYTSSQAQYITQWSRVLRSSGPNHSKPLRVPEFIVHLPTGKTLKPPPHLRI
jgi:hypothetical protein